MTPERLSYLMQENLLRGECSATRDELHWIFTQLAIETKRAEEAERDFAELRVMWANVSGALCDAGSVVVYERDYARSVRELTAERDAAEAKLATAQSELKVAWSNCHDGLCHACAKCYDAAEAKLAMAVEGFVSIKSYLNNNPGTNALGVVTNRWVSDVCNYALRALGIDPSKE